METTKQESVKCEFCEQKFNKEKLTNSFNKIYNFLCLKCSDYIMTRGNMSEKCSEYCQMSGKCDGSCE